MAATGISVVPAVWPQDHDRVARLMLAYAASLTVALDFQNFDSELAGLPGDYAVPSGLALVGTVGGVAAGVGCYRRFGTGCEMKRLYVAPEFRGSGLGRHLAVALIAAARRAGYPFMVLDSLPEMAAAQALYRQLGFVRCEPYYASPIAGTTYMRLDLS